ncbi:alpha/beta fold hydrolase [Streptomyces lunaelactis]|uniref:alpha/beta hydrolase n=1 Tax=Streptomyces lunaelactis TaxID=1535768 RepID=UPI0015852A07|nr:alpha/beta hydrolase [Streptomyces lunaelactis]NUK53964.1 alpha/beta fold hydrolase [Streptomyces lunaelactis]NUK66331.1 alpha/beta fold hydrolase [Streptomyces lunaelactis]NUL06733.1 alpha/beta fold hydrolase [Streptomyces lunaelactis]
MRAVAKYGAVASLSSLVLSALVLAPAGGATATTAQSHATIAESHGTAVAAGRAAAAGISFGRCPTSEMLPDSIQCGTVKVPLDYARPAGKQIELTVSRGRATGKPAEHQGAFVYNPGGPGASSMYFPMVSRLPEWERIARAYDIVGYSPRGVGRSAPLSCQNPADFTRAPTLAPVHPSPSYKQERIARAKAYAQGCARNAGPALRHYTSLNNARDLDVLRAALKQKQLTFMGASYGTYFGALYATLFPSHVRRMVFDSAVNPDARGIWYRSNLAQSYAFESRWADFRAWAAKHDRTYDLGATPEEVSRSYEKARAALAHKPAGGKVGPGQLHAAFLATGYSDDFWVPRATALSEYLKGNEKPLIDQAAPDPAGARNAENGNAVYTAVLCNDAPWPTEWEVWDRDNSELALLAPFETWDNAFMNLPCAYWPAPRQQPLEVRTKRGALPPTLILAAERDAATPYEGARELARRLKGAVLITERDAGTHGIGGGANECVNSYLEDYLLRGETPVRRAECAPHPEPDPVSLDRRAASPRLPRAV